MRESAGARSFLARRGGIGVSFLGVWEASHWRVERRGGTRVGFIFKRSLCCAWIGAGSQQADQGGDAGGPDQGGDPKEELSLGPLPALRTRHGLGLSI